MERTLSERLRTIRLFDVYGRLLTARQQRLLRLYYHDDLSLGEIAERFRVTRQAVSDALRRSTAELERLEASLQFVESGDAARRRKRAVDDRVAALEAAVSRLAERVGSEAVDALAQEVAALRRVTQ